MERHLGSNLLVLKKRLLTGRLSSNSSGLYYMEKQETEAGLGQREVNPLKKKYSLTICETFLKGEEYG